MEPITNTIMSAVDQPAALVVNPVQMVQPLLDLLLRPEYLYLMAGAWILIQMGLRLCPDRVVDHPVTIRLLPVLPVALCSVGIWIPGIRPDETVGVVVLIGLILGWSVGGLHKTIFQTVFGQDPRIKAAKVAKAEALASDSKP